MLLQTTTPNRKTNKYHVRPLGDVGFTPNVSTRLDKRNNTKPQSSAYVNGKTIWFTLYRMGKPGHVWEGEWQPITRTHKLTPARAAMVRRILKARELANLEAIKTQYPETLAARAARVYGGVKLVELGVSA